MKKTLKPIPHFKSDAAEGRFWQTHDSTEYIDWSKAKSVSFPNLKPSVKTISLRLPESTLANLKSIANKKDIPYQSLIKVMLTEKIKLEMKA